MFLVPLFSLVWSFTGDASQSLLLCNPDCYVTGLDQFVGTGAFCPTIVIFLGYGLAVASSTYCLTFFFSDHAVAQVGQFISV